MKGCGLDSTDSYLAGQLECTSVRVMGPGQWRHGRVESWDHRLTRFHLSAGVPYIGADF